MKIALAVLGAIVVIFILVALAFVFLVPRVMM